MTLTSGLHLAYHAIVGRHILAPLPHKIKRLLHVATQISAPIFNPIHLRKD